MFIAIVSTTVETNNPIAELNPGLALLGNIAERSPPPPSVSVDRSHLSS
jgi:RAB protein geranylgeranyltransferase component A